MRLQYVVRGRDWLGGRVDVLRDYDVLSAGILKNTIRYGSEDLRGVALYP